MQTEKFGFRIRAQNGAVIERVLIQAKSEEDSRSKLFRMYPRSEILSAWLESEPAAQSPMSFEHLADLLND
jgi:hypothetical protein